MKKALIVIIVLLIVGAVAGVTGSVIYAANDGVMKDAEKKTVKLDYSGEDLSIESDFDKIEVEVIDGNQIIFDYYESEKVKRTIENEEGEISFETEAPHFFNWFIGNKYVLKISVPQDFGGKLEIESETGSVLVNLNEVRCKEIDIEITTGNVTIKNATCTGDFSLETTTGSIIAENIAAGVSAKVEATTGNVEIRNLSAKDVKIKMTTGSLKKGEINCQSFSAEATTGSLSFSLSGATKIYLKATTGDVRGKIVGIEKDFNVETSTTTGKSSLRNQTVVGSDKSIVAKTTTGSINIEFIEE